MGMVHYNTCTIARFKNTFLVKAVGLNDRRAKGTAADIKYLYSVSKHCLQAKPYYPGARYLLFTKWNFLLFFLSPARNL